MRGRWLLAGLVLACAGCGGPPADTGRFVPPPSAARDAVEAALRSWQTGRPPAELAPGPPRVELVDTLRPAGRPVLSYQILGEVLGGDGPRCFAVRVVLDKPRAEIKVRYLVFGDDPVWVFRQEEYEMFTHWDCGNRPDRAGTKRLPTGKGP